jgi:hypothetical protein
MALLELSDSSVDITVEDKTTLKGAVIASTANDLNLDTGSLEYSNIFDSKKSTSIGGGVSGSGIGSTNGVSSSANINYSLSNSTQVNIATIGEGNITVRDGGSTDKLNRDTTATQIMTSDTGMKGGATVDSDTINLLTTNPVTSVDNAIDSAAGIAFKAITDGANVVNDTMVVAEKTGNLVSYGAFGLDTDRNVVTAKLTDQMSDAGINLNGVDPVGKIGQKVMGNDGTVYVVGANGLTMYGRVEDYTPGEPGGTVDTNAYGKYLEDKIYNTWKESTPLIINALIAELEQINPDAAREIKAGLAGINAAEKREQAYALQLATDSSLRNAELGLYDETEKIYKDQNIVHKGLGIQNTTTVGSSFSFYTLSAGIESNRTFMGHIELTIDKTDYSNSSITLTGATWTSTNYKTGAGNYHADDNTQYGLGGAVVSAGNSFGFTLEPSANKAIENIAGKSTSIDVSTPVIVGVNVSQSDKNENGNSWRNAGLDVGIGIQATCGRPTTKFDVKKEQDEAIKGTVSLKDIVNSITKD